MKTTTIKLFSLTFFLLLISCKNNSKPIDEASVKDVMDKAITRLYKEVPSENYNSINEEFMLNFFTEEEKNILATKYQYFKVNVPVTVSLMRDKNQATLPFWLKESGFTKTNKIVKNEVYTYEVWQKDFEPGWVQLGINGFGMHRPVYFVTVGAKNKQDALTVSEVYPSQFSIETMEEGAFTYHDWSGLEITEFPKEIEGHKLFTTIRGRAREAHAIGAFRKTIYPTSATPDQVLLTWSKDPTNSIDIQWRNNLSVNDGFVKYWLKGTKDTLTTEASKIKTEDRLLYNDRYIHRFTASLSGLKDASTYQYLVGSQNKKSWSKVSEFKTEKKNQDKFSFIWFGDTHKDPKWGEMLQVADKKHEDVSFYSIAGDIVTTGLYRNEWDELFGYSKDVFSNIPLMPVPGNHDRQDGLGTRMYYEIFSLPENGPEKVHPESTYSFEYGNALYLMIDSTHPNEAQTAWIEDQLKNTKATWKFAMFHFPPYNHEEPYLDIQTDWGGIFDKYHVDMVMSGHIHYYMRSKPINNSKIVESYKDGTVYVISIGTKGNHSHMNDEPYAEKRYHKNKQFYQYMSIDGNKLKYTAYDGKGDIVDEFSIKK